MSDHNKEVNIHISFRSLVNAALIVLFILFIFAIKNIVLVLLASIVVASFVESGVKKMRRAIGMNRTLSVLGIYFLGLALLVAIFYAFLPVFTSEVSNLVRFMADYLPPSSFLSDFQDESTVDGAKAIVSGISHNISLTSLISKIQVFVAGISGGFLTAASVLFGGIFNLVLLIVLSFYLSMQERGIESFLRIVTPKNKEAYVISLWQRTEHKIGLWVQGQLLLGLIVGLVTYIGLSLMGVEYAFLLALAAAICELIPFGIILAAIPGIIFGYVSGGVSLAVIVILFYTIVQQIEGYILAPLIVKKVVGVSPLIVILSLLIGATLAGFWGILLAVPVAVCLLQFFDDLEKKKLEA